MGGEADRHRRLEEQEKPSPSVSSSPPSHLSSLHLTTSSSSLARHQREEELVFPDLHFLFAYYNDTYFKGSLSAVEVRWSKRMTLCAGLCVYQRRGGYCSVRLSEPLLKFRSPKEYRETLLHEMIHAYLFVTAGNDKHEAHGPEFLSHMHRLNRLTGLNITVYHNFHDEVNHYRTHIWRCQGKCRQRPPYFGYLRRAMNRAPGPSDRWWAEHQETCGGQYVKIAEPQAQKRKPAFLASRPAAKHEKPTALKGVSPPVLRGASTERKGEQSRRELGKGGSDKVPVKRSSSDEPGSPLPGDPAAFRSPGSLSDMLSRVKRQNQISNDEVVTKSESEVGQRRNFNNNTKIKVDVCSAPAGSSSFTPSSLPLSFSTSSAENSFSRRNSSKSTPDRFRHSNSHFGDEPMARFALDSSFSSFPGSVTSFFSVPSSSSSSSSSASSCSPSLSTHYRKSAECPQRSSVESSDDEVQITGIRRPPSPGSSRYQSRSLLRPSSDRPSRTRSQFSTPDSEGFIEEHVVSEKRRRRGEAKEEPNERRRQSPRRLRHHSPSETACSIAEFSPRSPKRERRSAMGNSVEDIDTHDRRHDRRKHPVNVVEDLTTEGLFGEPRKDTAKVVIVPVHNVEEDDDDVILFSTPTPDRKDPPARRSLPVCASPDRSKLGECGEKAKACAGVPFCRKRGAKTTGDSSFGSQEIKRVTGRRDVSSETGTDSPLRANDDGACVSGSRVDAKQIPCLSENSSLSPRGDHVCRCCGARFEETLVLRRHIQCCIRDPSRLRGRSDLAPVSSTSSETAEANAGRFTQ